MACSGLWYPLNVRAGRGRFFSFSFSRSEKNGCVLISYALGMTSSTFTGVRAPLSYNGSNKYSCGHCKIHNRLTITIRNVNGLYRVSRWWHLTLRIPTIYSALDRTIFVSQFAALGWLCHRRIQRHSKALNVRVCVCVCFVIWSLILSALEKQKKWRRNKCWCAVLCLCWALFCSQSSQFNIINCFFFSRAHI